MAGDHFSFETNEFGFRSVTPLPTQAELDQFYNEVYFSTPATVTYQVEYTDNEIAQKRLRANATVEFIRCSLSEIGEHNLLEIGCGEGFLLAAALNQGWEVSGVDFQIEPILKHNPSVAEYVLAANPSSYIDQLIKSGSKYEIVIIQNVLEHVREPGVMLQKIKNLLTDTGKCVVQVPNDFSELQSLAFTAKQIKKEYWFSPPQHLHYFNNSNIIKFVESVGLKVIDGIGDFPIELFLFCGEKNYVSDPKLGPLAHSARVTLDLFFARNSMTSYLDLCRSFYEVGIGRNLCVIMSREQPSESIECKN